MVRRIIKERFRRNGKFRVENAGEGSLREKLGQRMVREWSQTVFNWGKRRLDV